MLEVKDFEFKKSPNFGWVTLEIYKNTSLDV
jgi:hypothetical protein